MEKKIKILDTKKNVFLYTIEGVEFPSVYTMLVTTLMIREANPDFHDFFVCQAKKSQLLKTISDYHNARSNEMPLNKLFELAAEEKYAPVVALVWEARKKLANKIAIIPPQHSFIFLYQ